MRVPESEQVQAPVSVREQVSVRVSVRAWVREFRSAPVSVQEYAQAEFRFGRSRKG